MTTTIAVALQDLLFTPELPLDEALERHFTPDYTQRTDGTWNSRTAFAEHIAHLRTVVAKGSVEVHDELSSGLLYADRHTVNVVKKDGSRVAIEVYAFGEYARDGRFRRIEETTLLLSGTVADRALATARQAS